jgi:hypothetical protein
MFMVCNLVAVIALTKEITGGSTAFTCGVNIENAETHKIPIIRTANTLFVSPLSFQSA